MSGILNKRFGLGIILILLSLGVFGSSTPGSSVFRCLAKGTNRSSSSESAIRFSHPLKLDMPLNLAVMQDQDGFLWFSTQNGIVRYDGYTAQVYRSGPESLSNGNVVSIVEDKKGSLWIGTQGGGINYYDKQTNRFTVYRNDPSNPKSLGSDIIAYAPQALCLDGNTLWIGTQGYGLDRLDLRTQTFTHYRHDPNKPGSIASDTVWSIFKDSKDRLWIGDMAGLERLDRKTGTFIHYRHNPADPKSIGQGWVYRILEDRKNPDLIWLGTIGSGLLKFHPDTGEFTRFYHEPHGPDEITALCQDNHNRLWIGWYRVPSQGGLSIFDPTTGKYSDYLPAPSNNNSPSTPKILGIFQDRSGIVWLANQNGSIDKYDPIGEKFRLYRHDPNNPYSLSEDTMLSLYEDSAGTLWFGALASGLNKYDRNTDSFIHYAYDPADLRSIRSNFVSRTFEDSSKTFWVATRGGALSIFDRATGRCVKHYQHDPANPSSIPENDSIRCIIEDKDDPNILWMGAFVGGFFKFDKRTEKFTSYEVKPNDPTGLNCNTVYYLYQDRDGIIWMTTPGGGINRFDKTTGKFSHYVHDPHNPASIGSNHTWEIHEYTPGTLWIGTEGGGLEKFDKQRKNFYHYDKAHGFPANTVLTIRQDRSGNLWLGTDEGLVQFDPSTGKTKVYKKGDGLQGEVFLDNSAVVTRDGQMWFGGVNGVNSFYPDRIRDNPYVPPIVLTSLKQSGEEMKVGKALTRLKTLKLDWQHNYFEFEFAALNYTLPDKNQYAYKLEGFDKDWYYAGTRRFGRYSGLLPGSYTLRIRGSNNDGVWNNRGVSLKVVVVPPFWRDPWFLGSLTLLFIVAAIFLFILRVRRIERQKWLLKAQVEERTKELKVAKEAAEAANQTKSSFLAKMSHELRTPLNGILGYAQILLRKTTDDDLRNGLGIIQSSGEHLLALINDILDLSKIEAGKMEIHPTRVHLRTFLETVESFVRERIDEKGITFAVETDGDIPNHMMADEIRLRQVLLNLLGNAVKFTERGRIDFVVKRIGDSGENQVSLRFEVRDTGVGIAPDDLKIIFDSFEQVGDIRKRASGTGLGLAICRQLLQLMGSTLNVESRLGQGSRFWFDLPLFLGEPSEPKKQSHWAIRGYDGPRRSVLVVDDYPSNRAVLSDFLTHLGFDVFEAENGKRAIDEARRVVPDLVLMDRLMPVMNGLEAVQAMREIPELAGVPIAVVSASVSQEEQAESLSQGFDAFLGKPINWSELTSLLEKQLNLKWRFE